MNSECKSQFKVGIITQVRMGSERLPGKVMLQVKGQPLLKYHTDRLRQSGLPVFLATTTKPADKPIIDFAAREDLPYYRGDEKNVLSRYYECARQFGLDVVIRVTSDCPLIDGNIIHDALEIYLKQDDSRLYLTNGLKSTFPRGLGFEIFSFQLLEEAFHKADRPEELEHVTPYINRNRAGNVIFHHYTRKEDKSNYRITVDTIDDFILIQKMIEGYNAHLLSTDEIILLLDEHPELVAINAHVQQKIV